MFDIYNFQLYSISRHFEPAFLVTLILDLANYLMVLSIFFFLYKYNKITISLFILIVFLLATPFIFNGFLFDWTYFPDQSKYVNHTRNLRYEIFNNTSCMNFISQEYHCNRSDKITSVGYFYAISPIISFETFKSLAFWNRGIFLLTLVYFINKNVLKTDLLLLFLFVPSLILFTSLSLRESPIIVLMLLYIYFFYNKKYFLCFICIALLYTTKAQNVLILLFASYVIYIFEGTKFKSNFFLISLIVITPILIFFFQDILNLANESRKGLFVEEFGQYKSVSSGELYDLNYSINNLNLNTYKIIFFSLFEFLISPMKNLSSTFKTLLALENIVLYAFIIRAFFNTYKIDKKVFYSWIIISIFGLWMYSIFLFNDAQIHRYKTPVIFFIIFGLSLGLEKRKINQ